MEIVGAWLCLARLVHPEECLWGLGCLRIGRKEGGRAGIGMGGREEEKREERRERREAKHRCSEDKSEEGGANERGKEENAMMEGDMQADKTDTRPKQDLLLDASLGSFLVSFFLSLSDKAGPLSLSFLPPHARPIESSRRGGLLRSFAPTASPVLRKTARRGAARVMVTRSHWPFSAFPLPPSIRRSLDSTLHSLPTLGQINRMLPAAC